MTTPTLADAISEILKQSWAAGGRSSIVIPLEKEVRSGTCGLEKYTYTVGRYERKTAFYKFLLIEAWWSLQAPAGARFRLCCFKDGGQASQEFDGITLLNFVTPEHVMNEIKKRVASAGPAPAKPAGGSLAADFGVREE